MDGIFDKKCRQKEKYREERTNERMSIFKVTLQLVLVSLYTKFEVSILNGCGDIFEEKPEKKEQIQGRTNRRMAICNPTTQFVSANFHIKFKISILNGCGDIFDEKSRGTEKTTNIGKNKNRKRPIFNSTIQLVVVNLYTKFKVSILNSCGDIFDKNLERKKKEEKNK